MEERKPEAGFAEKARQEEMEMDGSRAASAYEQTSKTEDQACLKEYATKDLLEELKQREGVKSEYAEPYQQRQICVNGPAEILVVID